MKRILLLGDGGVGKTTLVHYMKTKLFTTKYIPTMGMEIHPFDSFQIIDTAGQERYGRPPEEWIGIFGPDAVLLMFSVDSKQSYRNLQYWYDWVPEGVPVIILGTKCDIDERRMTQENTRFHIDNALPYFDISVKSGLGLESLGNYLDRILAETKAKDASNTAQSLVT